MVSIKIRFDWSFSTNTIRHLHNNTVMIYMNVFKRIQKKHTHTHRRGQALCQKWQRLPRATQNSQPAMRAFYSPLFEGQGFGAAGTTVLPQMDVLDAIHKRQMQNKQKREKDPVQTIPSTDTALVFSAFILWPRADVAAVFAPTGRSGRRRSGWFPRGPSPACRA